MLAGLLVLACVGLVALITTVRAHHEAGLKTVGESSPLCNCVLHGC